MTRIHLVPAQSYSVDFAVVPSTHTVGFLVAGMCGFALGEDTEETIADVSTAYSEN